MKPLPEPAPINQLKIIAGLFHCPTCREWFRQMGITLAVFSDKRCHSIAAWCLLGGSTMPQDVRKAIEAPSDRSSIAEWFLEHCGAGWEQDHGHLARMQVALRATAKDWAPAMFRWGAELIADGKDTSRYLEIIARVAAFVAWNPHTPGEIWVHNPGTELLVHWPPTKEDDGPEF